MASPRVAAQHNLDGWSGVGRTPICNLCSHLYDNWGCGRMQWGGNQTQWPLWAVEWRYNAHNCHLWILHVLCLGPMAKKTNSHPPFPSNPRSATRGGWCAVLFDWGLGGGSGGEGGRIGGENVVECWSRGGVWCCFHQTMGYEKLVMVCFDIWYVFWIEYGDLWGGKRSMRWWTRQNFVETVWVLLFFHFVKGWYC